MTNILRRRQCYTWTALTCLLLACGPALRAQNASQIVVPGPQTYQAMVQQFLAAVRTDSLKTGVLYDRAPSLSNLLRGPDTTGPGRLRQAVFELEAARQETDSALYGAAGQLDALRYRYRRSRTLPLSILDVRLQTLDTNALDDGRLRLTADSLLETTPGHETENPYLETRRTLAGLLPFWGQAQKGTVYVKLDPDGIVANTGQAITGARLFHGGDTLTLALGDSAALTVAETDTALALGVEVLYAGGAQPRSGGTAVAGVQAEPDWESLYKPCDTARYAGASVWVGNYPSAEAQPTSSAHGLVDMAVYYGVAGAGASLACADITDRRLDRPVVIVDGFDPFDTRGPGTIYGERLGFRDASGSPVRLGDKLRRLGYDIIILNFPDHYRAPNRRGRYNPPLQWWEKDHGAGFVEQNALAVAEALKSIKARMEAAGSTEKMVVIGPSMGGLITRYALKEMEDQGIDHKVGLWVSFDAPHLGANIPMGDQQFIREFAGLSAAAREQCDRQIRSAAARQMLVNHELAETDAVNGAPTARALFQGRLDAKGFPQNCRRVAIVNGALNSAPQLNRFGQPLQGGNTAFAMQVWGATHTGILSPPNNSNPIISSTVWFAPGNGGTGRVYQKNLYYMSFLALPFRFWSYIVPRWQVTLTKKTSHALDNGVSLDVAPGGYFNTQSIIAENRGYQDILLPNGGGMNTYFFQVQPRHCFIPSKSALAYTGGFHDLGQNLMYRNLTCTGETPFDNYYAPDTNMDHTQINRNIENFLLAELQALKTGNLPEHAPTYLGLNFTPSSTTCNGITAKLESPYITWPNSDVVWTYGSQLAADGPTSERQIALAPNTTSGTYDLIARMKYPARDGKECEIAGSQIYSWVPLNQVPLAINPDYLEIKYLAGRPASLTTREIKGVGIVNPPANSTYQWNVADCADAGLHVDVDASHTGATFYVRDDPYQDDPNGPLEHPTERTNISVTANTPCGPREGTSHIYLKRVPPMIVAPNPAVIGEDLAFEVRISRNLEGTPADGPFEYKLTDERKETVRSGEAQSSPFQIETGGLQTATYELWARNSAGEEWTADVNLVSEEGSHLTASPNPARQGVDDEATVRVVGGPAAGSYELTLSTFSGQQLQQLSETEPEFHLNLNGMQSGTYVITVKEGTQTWTEDLDFLLGTAPYLTVSPNPASTMVTAILNDPVYPSPTLDWQIRDLNGNILAQATAATGPELHIDVSQVPTGYHTLTVHEGKDTYSKHITIAR